jgi:hypothetical protein
LLVFGTFPRRKYNIFVDLLDRESQLFLQARIAPTSLNLRHLQTSRTSPSQHPTHRDTISTFLNAIARAHYQAINPVPTLTIVEINALVEKKFQERLVTLENELFDRLAARLPVTNSAESIDSLELTAIEDTPPANNSFSDLWRQSLSSIMLSDEPDSDT